MWVESRGKEDIVEWGGSIRGSLLIFAHSGAFPLNLGISVSIREPKLCWLVFTSMEYRAGVLKSDPLEVGDH